MLGSLALGLSMTSVPAAPADSVPAPGTDTIHAQFECRGGRGIRAVFHNGPSPSVELYLSDGRHIVLHQALSGSGARYANADESFVFWNKGRTALIIERGATSHAECVQSR